MPDTQITTTEQRKTAIEHALAQHSGSLERFRHWTRRIIYTPGVEDMAKICNAYWLIDLVASHQITPSVRAEEFQVWKLSVEPSHTGALSCEDGNYRTVFSKKLEFTDFPEPGIELWFANNTIYLPSEH